MNSQWNPDDPRAKRGGAFSLIELLVVMGLMGMLAAIGLPALKGFGQSNAMSAANRQLLDDVGLARAMAIKNRTTVYMVFVPTNLAAQLPRLSTAQERRQLTNLSGGQYTGYALLAKRTVGDQPGQDHPRYLTDWRKLPEGVFIAPSKYAHWARNSWQPFLNTTNRPFAYYDQPAGDPGLPFPTSTSRRWPLPYIAFNSAGQLARPTHDGTPLKDEIISLTRGSIFYARDKAGQITLGTPDIQETPPGNSTNMFNYIHIDWMTGRPRVEKQEIR
jgi:prepilin-type N-terminal cleavage/methylation domain-containing protein